MFNLDLMDNPKASSVDQAYLAHCLRDSFEAQRQAIRADPYMKMIIRLANNVLPLTHRGHQRSPSLAVIFLPRYQSIFRTFDGQSTADQ